jgi:protein-disulfide isomerase
MKNPWIIIGVITIVVFGGAIWYANQSAAAANEGVEVKQNIKGNADASVELVEYSDFQCPACGAFYPVVKDLLAQYGDQLRFEYKHFPLSNIHPFAQSAAMAAEAAGQQDKFFEFHDQLFENQQSWSQSAAPTAQFVSYAEEIGLDIEQFRRQMNASILRDKVRAEFEEGRELGVTGTPTFFLNGERMQFTTYEEFISQIEEAVNPGASTESGDGETSNDVEEAGAVEVEADTGVRFGL